MQLGNKTVETTYHIFKQIPGMIQKLREFLVHERIHTAKVQKDHLATALLQKMIQDSPLLLHKIIQTRQLKVHFCDDVKKMMILKQRI